MAEVHSTTGRTSRQQRAIPRRKFTNQAAKERSSKDQSAQQELNESGSCSSLSCSVDDKRLHRRPRARGPRRGQRNQTRRTKSDTLLPHLPKGEGDRARGRLRRHHSDTGVNGREYNSVDTAPKMPLRRYQSDVETSTRAPGHVKSTQMQFGDGKVGSVESISIGALVGEVEPLAPTEEDSLHSSSMLCKEDQKQRSKWSRFESPFSIQQPLVSMVFARFRNEKTSSTEAM